MPLLRETAKHNTCDNDRRRGVSILFYEVVLFEVSVKVSTSKILTSKDNCDVLCLLGLV